jgi:DNA polymerase III delta prime subunit
LKGGYDVETKPKEPKEPRLHIIDEDDLVRMNVPEEFWPRAAAGLSGLTPSIAPVVKNYARQFDEMMHAGTGLMLIGNSGVGKTGAAVALLKYARERFKTGYFIRIAELREALFSDQDFDSDTSVMSRCRSVDFLVLDDFGEMDLNAKFFKLDELQDLIVSRGPRRRPTIVTSSLSQGDILHKRSSFLEAVGTYTPLFEVTGPDRREKRREALLKKLTSKGDF